MLADVTRTWGDNVFWMDLVVAVVGSLVSSSFILLGFLVSFRLYRRERKDDLLDAERVREEALADAQKAEQQRLREDLLQKVLEFGDFKPRGPLRFSTTKIRDRASLLRRDLGVYQLRLDDPQLREFCRLLEAGIEDIVGTYAFALPFYGLFVRVLRLRDLVVMATYVLSQYLGGGETMKLGVLRDAADGTGGKTFRREIARVQKEERRRVRRERRERDSGSRPD